MYGEEKLFTTIWKMFWTDKTAMHFMVRHSRPHIGGLTISVGLSGLTFRMDKLPVYVQSDLLTMSDNIQRSQQ